MAKQEEAIVQLQTRIQELQGKIVEISSKAIDGASSEKAFNQFMQVQKENGAASQQKRGS